MPNSLKETRARATAAFLSADGCADIQSRHLEKSQQIYNAVTPYMADRGHVIWAVVPFPSGYSPELILDRVGRPL